MQAERIRADLEPGWLSRPQHRRWLADRAEELFAFYERASINPRGGFYELDLKGNPARVDNHLRGIHSTARMVHCFTIAALLGRPGAERIVDHGMRFLWQRHRDEAAGGYFWRVDDNGPADSTKQGYGHAFVLLAASSASLIGHPLADAMLKDVTEVIEQRFWEEQHGAIAEEFRADWSVIAPYHGQNSNMHLTEALMAAFEATGYRAYLDKAERIADLIIRRRAGENDFRVPEHFDGHWNVDKAYAGDLMFRPQGTTPGHALEWSRLVLQLWALGGQRHDWMPGASEALFRQAVTLGWDHNHGGFFYNLGWDDRPDSRMKLWWPMSEAAGAAAFLCQHRPSPYHETWYRNIWDTIAARHLDRENGGWREELSEDMRPSYSLFTGKGDIYHALQACLIPLYPATGSLTKGIRETQRQG